MMVEYDVDFLRAPGPTEIFDGTSELSQWFNAPPLSIFSRNKHREKPTFLDIDLKPIEMVPRVDDKAWVEEGLSIIKERIK